MAWHYPEFSERNILGDATSDWGTGFHYRLFKNSVSAGQEIDETDLTEADFPGYAAISAVKDGGVVTETGKAVQHFDPLVWTNSSGDTGDIQTIYGIYLTDSSAELVCYEVFGSPINIGVGTPIITASPKHTLNTE